MSQKVRILFRSMQRPITPEGGGVSWDSPQCQQIGAEAVGEYYRRGDSHYCLYEEQQEGWDQPVKTVLKWKGHTLELQRRGIMATRMFFEPGSCYCHPYRTPCGELLMETETRVLEVKQGRETFELAVEYGLKLEGQPISENRMEIRIIYI